MLIKSLYQTMEEAVVAAVLEQQELAWEALTTCFSKLPETQPVSQPQLQPVIGANPATVLVELLHQQSVLAVLALVAALTSLLLEVQQEMHSQLLLLKLSLLVPLRLQI